MVQMFTQEKEPHFGEMLGQALGQGLGGGFQGGLSAQLNQMMEQKKQQSLLEGLGLRPSQQGSSLVKSTEQTGLSPSSAQQPIKIKPEQVIAASLANPELGRALGTIYQGQQASAEKKAVYEQEKADKFLTETRKVSESLPGRKLALTSAINAVKSGVGKIGDWFADAFGVPQLRGAPAAQLNAAAKANLIESLGSMPGARPNMFIEQKIDQAFAKAGQSKEANLSQLEILKSLYDIDEHRNNLTLELANKYEEAGLPPPGNLDRVVAKEVTGYNENRMKELSYDLQELTEQDQGPRELERVKKVPEGTPLTYQKGQVLLRKVGTKDLQNPTEEEAQKALRLAQNMGYEIPPPSIYTRKK